MVNSIVGMATMPGRETSCVEALASIAPQVSRVILHVNEYARVGAIRLPRNVTRVISAANLGDQAKVTCLFPHMHTADVFFTCDDDICFPSDYVEGMLTHRAELARALGTTPAIAAHGARLPAVMRSWGEQTCFHFAKHVGKAQQVDLLGTGCALFTPEQIQCFAADGLGQRTRNMADVWVALALARAGVARWVAPHPAGWLTALRYDSRAIAISSRARDGSVLDTSAAALDAIETAKRTGSFKLVRPGWRR